MRKNYIALIDNHLSDFHVKGETFGMAIDDTISHLEQVVLTAQTEIEQLKAYRRVVARMALPDYESPNMPKVTQLPDESSIAEAELDSFTADGNDTKGHNETDHAELVDHLHNVLNEEK